MDYLWILSICFTLFSFLRCDDQYSDIFDMLCVVIGAKLNLCFANIGKAV